MPSNINKVISLLRSGALEQAEKEYLRLGLDREHSSEDVMALGGRILKAKAIEQTGTARKQLALQAAEKYAAAHTHFGGTFSGINTAAMLLVGGEIKKAQTIATQVQETLKKHHPKPGPDAYYHIATVAEAWLILGETLRAEHTLADAIILAPHNYEAHASTLKQFEMLLAALEQPGDWLEAFRPPKALHFAGHLFNNEDLETLPKDASIYAMERAVSDILKTNCFGAGYGALAAGSDIIIAEQLLAHGVELHVVLPCPEALFSSVSLAPYGSHWQARFETCLKKATSIRHVSSDETLCDDLTTSFASETAMGLAVLHAEQLATDAEQMLIWDGKNREDAAGTAYDASVWSATNRPQHIIEYPFKRKERAGALKPKTNRNLKAMLFADVKGFGDLSEQQIPLFIEHILNPLADCCDMAHQKPEHINTWGDGLFLVFSAVQSAANAAVQLQNTFRAVDLKAKGLPESLTLRIGGHYGPVHSLDDPFTNRTGFFGREVTTAARIEPVTAPGSIFVSEPFACVLALRAKSEFRCEPMLKPLPVKAQKPLTLFSLRKMCFID